MVALKKQRYGTSRIAKGDTFHVRDEHVALLKALGLVKDVDMAAVKAMSAENTSALIPNPARIDAKVGTTTPHLTMEPIENENADQAEATDETAAETTDQTNASVLGEDDISKTIEQSTEYSQMIRNRARSLGIHVDGRWSDARVQREIDEHNKKTYQHMDMRSE